MSLTWIKVPHTSLLDACAGRAALTGLRTIFARLPGTGTNPLRITMRPHRAVILLMIITRTMILQTLDMSTLSEFGMLGLAAASLYFGACAACPPGQRLPRLQTSRTFT